MGSIFLKKAIYFVLRELSVISRFASMRSTTLEIVKSVM